MGRHEKVSYDHILTCITFQMLSMSTLILIVEHKKLL